MCPTATLKSPLSCADQVTADLILVGGGLANSLIALRLAASRPEIKVVLLERQNSLGGNHTWSFHDTDVTAKQRAELVPLIAKSWPTHEVRFPTITRSLSGGYNSILSSSLHRSVSEALGDGVILEAEVKTIAPGEVGLEDGRILQAPAVIDGRGAAGEDNLEVGFQKFVGQVVRLEGGHGLCAPLLMDATIEQRDGFRFFYVLPFAGNRLLIEDTRYSNEPDLDRAELREEISRYAAVQNWKIVDIEREEEGVLPVVLDGDIEAFWGGNPGVPRSGIRAGLFNFTTGYSLAEAIRFADLIAAQTKLDSADLYRIVRARSEALWKRGAFLRLLNRMLFLAAGPSDRYRVLQHFYRLPEATINRFYAGRPSLGDRFRILSGKPPVAIAPAIRAILSTGLLAA
jgi:lycopene beta-cyclase